MRSDSISQNIPLQIFDVIQSEVALHTQNIPLQIFDVIQSDIALHTQMH